VGDIGEEQGVKMEMLDVYSASTGLIRLESGGQGLIGCGSMEKSNGRRSE